MRVSQTRLLGATFCSIAIVLGAAQAWSYRDTISSVDAVSYLDIADAYRQGRWGDAVNGYWNPLYSWVLAVVMTLVRPEIETEYQIVKVVDYVIYLACLCSFVWFLSQFRNAYRRSVALDSKTVPVPDWMWMVVGYTLFIWSSLNWITLSSNTPDMAAAALSYLAWGILISVRNTESRHRYRDDVLLGVVLALGYFARTPLFVVGCFIVVCCGNLLTPNPVRRRGALLTALVFFVLMAPFIEWISRARGHWTIGDNAWLNHFWLANPGRYVIPDTHWQGGPAGYGTPIHATRVIWPNPPAYEFASPIGGTFPPWTDPSYWYQGLTYHLDWLAEWTSFKHNVIFLGKLVATGLAFGLVLLPAADHRRSFRGIVQSAPYWTPAVIGLSLYLVANDLLIQYLPTQPPQRYVGTFVVLFCLSLYSGVRWNLNRAQGFEKPVRILLVAASAGVLLMLALEQVTLLRRPAATPPWKIASALRRVGVVRGMRVAIIGNKALHEPWARLDRVHVVAQAEDDRGFWNKSPGRQDELVGKLAQTGAHAIVGSRMSGPLRLGWTSIEDTGYAVRFLAEADREVARSVERTTQSQ